MIVLTKVYVCTCADWICSVACSKTMIIVRTGRRR